MALPAPYAGAIRQLQARAYPSGLNAGMKRFPMG